MRRGLRVGLLTALLPIAIGPVPAVGATVSSDVGTTVVTALSGATSTARATLTSSAIRTTDAAPAAAPSTGTDAITITADELIVEPAGVIVATGRVQISDGTTAAEGARAEVDLHRRTILLTPGTVRTSQGVLRGRRISARYAAARLTEIWAEGDVRLWAGTDLQAQGARLLYRLEGDLLTMAGAVRVEARRGVAEGDRLEARLLRREVTVWGSVRLRVDDMDATADRVSLLLPAQQAVLTGQVRLTQQGRTLWAQRVTVDYGTGRVVAEGPLRLTIPQEQQP
ncbi:MAG: LptA/OstA family protein [Armatimonadota bacterium]|nr:LptA/OstA family protein [Armatimonadota bacterium]MDR7428090.1 LptA/OstA family protein [Armatimonadota bacterium]MDR7470523.1 LptA/OstA family protein [Armatimonadota bacterium]MDR7475495.1 LptA/OstA family protein [Armatimonadota bacterium]